MLQGGHFQRIPKVETLDNIIKNMQNLVQGKKYNFISGLTSDFQVLDWINDQPHLCNYLISVKSLLNIWTQRKQDRSDN